MENETTSEGVFDKRPIQDDAQKPSPTAARPKEDFVSPENLKQQEMSHKAIRENEPPKIMGATPGKNDVQSDLDDLEKVSPEDLKLAEELIFKGYAEFDVDIPNLPGNSFTICSTSASEFNLIDEVLFDKVKDNEDKDGNVDMPQNKLQALRTALTIALSYRGRNKDELCKDSINHLNTIKRAIIKVNEYELSGDLKNMKELKDGLKQALLVRAIEVMKLPTPMIDFLSTEKFDFDTRMHRIMTEKQVLPKS